MENTIENQIIAPLFSDNVNVSLTEKERITNEISNLGRMLTFGISRSTDGWMAQCNEISGIIAGGNNNNPSNSEIESQIRESILSAFNVETKESPYFTFSEMKQEKLSRA